MWLFFPSILLSLISSGNAKHCVNRPKSSVVIGYFTCQNIRMKLLKFPEKYGDPILNRIHSIEKFVLEDVEGLYVDELLLILINYLLQYNADEYPELDRAEAHLNEARYWMLEHFHENYEEVIVENKEDECKK